MDPLPDVGNIQARVELSKVDVVVSDRRTFLHPTAFVSIPRTFEDLEAIGGSGGSPAAC